MKISNAGTTTLSEPEWDWGVEDSGPSSRKRFWTYFSTFGIVLATVVLAIVSSQIMQNLGVNVIIIALVVIVVFPPLAGILGGGIVEKMDAEIYACHTSDRTEALKRQEHWVATVFSPYLKERYDLDLMDLDYQNNTAQVKRNGEEIQVRFEGIEFTPNNRLDGGKFDGLYSVKITPNEVSVEQVICNTLAEV